MFGWFSKKGKKKKERTFLDLNQNPIQIGDKVRSFRYDLGICEVIEGENGGISYKSTEKDSVVSWIKMIDASTENQKVELINKENN